MFLCQVSTAVHAFIHGGLVFACMVIRKPAFMTPLKAIVVELIVQIKTSSVLPSCEGCHEGPTSIVKMSSSCSAARACAVSTFPVCDNPHIL